MGARFITCQKFKSKKGNDCFVVWFITDGGQVVNKFLTEDVFDKASDYEFGDELSISAELDKFGRPTLKVEF